MLLLNSFRFAGGPPPPPPAGRWVLTADSDSRFIISDDNLATWSNIDLSGYWASTNVKANIAVHAGLWVTANQYGDVDDVITSSDHGATWTNRTTPYEDVGYGWSSLASNGTNVVAVGEQDIGYSMIYSANGTAWSFSSNQVGGIRNWSTVIWVPELSLFVASCNSATNLVMTSPTGVTWTLRTAGAVNLYWDVGSRLAWSGTRMVRWGRNNSTNYLVYIHSTNGTSWTLVTTTFIDSGTSYPSDLLWDGSQFVLLVRTGSSSYTLTSPDGLNPWTQEATLPNECVSLGYDGTQYIAIKSGALGTHYRSEDLTTWTTSTTLPSEAYGGNRLQWIPN